MDGGLGPCLDGAGMEMGVLGEDWRVDDTVSTVRAAQSSAVQWDDHPTPGLEINAELAERHELGTRDLESEEGSSLWERGRFTLGRSEFEYGYGGMDGEYPVDAGIERRGSAMGFLMGREFFPRGGEEGVEMGWMRWDRIGGDSRTLLF